MVQIFFNPLCQPYCICVAVCLKLTNIIEITLQSGLIRKEHTNLHNHKYIVWPSVLKPGIGALPVIALLLLGCT